MEERFVKIGRRKIGRESREFFEAINNSEFHELCLQQPAIWNTRMDWIARIKIKRALEILVAPLPSTSYHLVDIIYADLPSKMPSYPADRRRGWWNSR